MSSAKKFITSYVLFFTSIIILVLYSSPEYSSVLKDSSNISRNISIVKFDESFTSINSLESSQLIEVELDEVPLGYYDGDSVNIDGKYIHLVPIMIVTLLFILILFNGKYFIKRIEG